MKVYFCYLVTSMVSQKDKRQLIECTRITASELKEEYMLYAWTTKKKLFQKFKESRNSEYFQYMTEEFSKQEFATKLNDYGMQSKIKTMELHEYPLFTKGKHRERTEIPLVITKGEWYAIESMETAVVVSGVDKETSMASFGLSMFSEELLVALNMLCASHIMKEYALCGFDPSIDPRVAMFSPEKDDGTKRAGPPFSPTYLTIMKDPEYREMRDEVGEDEFFDMYVEGYWESAAEQLSYDIGIGGTIARSGDVDTFAVFVSLFGFMIN